MNRFQFNKDAVILLLKICFWDLYHANMCFSAQLC